MILPEQDSYVASGEHALQNYGKELYTVAEKGAGVQPQLKNALVKFPNADYSSASSVVFEFTAANDAWQRLIFVQ